MAVSEAHKKASYKYNSGRDNIMLRPTKEEGQAIRMAAAASGLSLQNYILQGVRDLMQRDASDGQGGASE